MKWMLAGAVALGLSGPAAAETLPEFFTAWRGWVQTADYSPAAVARQAAAFPAWQARYAKLKDGSVDYRVVGAELAGFDFDLRVLKPWARDPSFYANVFADWSDVPAHEGPSAFPNIDLYDYKFPLSAADDARLTKAMAAIPGNLAAAKRNLAPSTAHDLWVYGDRAFKEQSAGLASLRAGTLVLRTLDGRVPATMTGASPALLAAIDAAKAATDDFAGWIAAEAPKHLGPSGVGKDNYNWYAKHVMLLPYDWDAQVLLLRRELDRSLASLRLEEVRNRALPPVAPLTDPAAYKALVTAKEARFSRFLAETGLGPDAPWATAAIAHQDVDFATPDRRDFFSHVTAQDPLPLISHFSHWIDLARYREEPNTSAIRRLPPLFNIYSNRSEGFATAYEELVMQAGLYDDVPHGRELVWVMLANRAARGLASLYVQSNDMGLAEAGKFHAGWTPRGWSDPNSRLVGFEQLLYARQPGYGPSYIIGKLQLDRLIADQSHADDIAGRPFDLKATMARIQAAGIVPVALIGAEAVRP